MVARVGGVIIAQHAWSLPDSRGVLVAALGNLRQHRRFRVGPVVVDTVGIGYHVATHLADQGYDVYAFNAGSSAIESEHFVNAKAEAYWCLRESLERGAIKGLTDEEMQAQLAGIRYRHTPSGRVEIESKEDAKKRGQQSPDRAEALVLAFATALCGGISACPAPQPPFWEAGSASRCACSRSGRTGSCRRPTPSKNRET